MEVSFEDSTITIRTNMWVFKPKKQHCREILLVKMVHIQRFIFFLSSTFKLIIFCFSTHDNWHESSAADLYDEITISVGSQTGQQIEHCTTGTSTEADELFLQEEIFPAEGNDIAYLMSYELVANIIHHTVDWLRNITSGWGVLYQILLDVSSA